MDGGRYREAATRETLTSAPRGTKCSEGETKTSFITNFRGQTKAFKLNHKLKLSTGRFKHLCFFLHFLF